MSAVALEAMRKEFKVLSKKAERAKAECDEYMGISIEAFAIHEELGTIVKSKEVGQHIIDKLEALKKRQDRVNRILKKDLLTLTDNQLNAEIKRDELAGEIQRYERRMR